MRVDSPSNVNLPAVRGDVQRVTEGATATASVNSGAVASSYTQASDFLRLLQAVQETPDVRADAVAEASTQISTGELLGPTSALETAQAIIDSQVLSPNS